MISKLLSLILTAILLSSCITAELVNTDSDILFKPKIGYFTTECKSYIFKTNINLYENDFSGIIVIKPINDKTYRIVFLNELGMNFFDLEITADSFKVYKILESLNRKSLLKLLVNDFRILVLNDINIQNSKKYLDTEGNFFVLRPDNTKNLYFIGRQDKLLYKIEQHSVFRKINTFEFENFENKFPKKISIVHKNVKFAIELSLIEIRK